MQKIIYVLAVVLLVSCGKQSKEYAKFSGLVAHNTAKEISIIGKGYKKVIPINADGTFSDTLKLQRNGFYTFFDGKNKQVIFISNGDNQNFNYDYINFNDGSIVVSGLGSQTSDFLIKKTNFDLKEKINNVKYFYGLKQDIFNTRIRFLESEVEKMLAVKGIDSTIVRGQKTYYDYFFNKVKSKHQKEYLLATSLGKGKTSPKFKDYLNYKGGKTSLDDFKGKYVYIDVWATWCGPCKQQIPYLGKIEKEYQGKNIAFVSISVDDARRNQGSWDKAKNKWRNMIKTKKMGGTQLFANRGFQSEFIKAYSINSIPRFLLIDPDGNIVNSNALRPSQPELKTLLNGLL